MYLLVLCVLLLIAVVVLVTLQAWGLSLFGESVDYLKFGTWGQAASALATTSALIVALTAQYLDRRRARDLQEQTQVEQETAVVLYQDSKVVVIDGRSIRVWDVIIQNQTTAPIYDWCLTFGDSGLPISSYSKRALQPGSNTFNIPEFDGVDSRDFPEPLLVFRGSSGRVWQRTSRGLTTQSSLRHLNECLEKA